jgi:hypothetical protein
MGLILLMENNFWILPISLISSRIYHLNFLVREKTIKDSDNNYIKDGLAKQKLSFLDVIDEIPSYQISSMKDMFYEAEFGSYPSVNEGEELNNNTNFKLDDSLRRRLEVYQLMQEK